MIATYIKWKDATIEESAEPGSPVSDDPLVELREFGWLIGETDTSISLSMELESDGSPGRQRLHIPKVNIVERINFDADRLFRLRPRRKRISTAGPNGAADD